MAKQERWMFRLPSNGDGETFFKEMRKYLNKDSYKVSKMYTGPRPEGTSPYATRKENATSVRIYVDSTQADIAYQRLLQDNIDLRSKLTEAYSALRTIDKVIDVTIDNQEDFIRRNHR